MRPSAAFRCWNAGIKNSTNIFNYRCLLDTKYMYLLKKFNRRSNSCYEYDKSSYLILDASLERIYLDFLNPYKYGTFPIQKWYLCGDFFFQIFYIFSQKRKKNGSFPKSKIKSRVFHYFRLWSAKHLQFLFQLTYNAGFTQKVQKFCCSNPSTGGLIHVGVS